MTMNARIGIVLDQRKPERSLVRPEQAGGTRGNAPQESSWTEDDS